MGILDYIERIKRENEGPRITAQEPRNMADGGRIGLKYGGILDALKLLISKGQTKFESMSALKNKIKELTGKRPGGSFQKGHPDYKSLLEKFTFEKFVLKKPKQITGITTISDELAAKIKNVGIKGINVSPDTTKAGQKSIKVTIQDPQVSGEFFGKNKTRVFPATEEGFAEVQKLVNNIFTSNIYTLKVKPFKTKEYFRKLKRLKEARYKEQDPFGIYEALRRYKTEKFPGSMSSDIQIQHGQPKFSTQTLSRWGLIPKKVNVAPIVEKTERIRNETLSRALVNLKKKNLSIADKKKIIEEFNNTMKGLRGQLKGTEGQGLVNFELLKLDEMGNVVKLKDVGFNPNKGLAYGNELGELDLAKISQEQADQIIALGKKKIDLDLLRQVLPGKLKNIVNPLSSGGRVGFKDGSGDIKSLETKLLTHLKNNPKLTKQIQKQLDEGVDITKILNSPAVKKGMPNWVKGELYFVAIDIMNNWTKGQSFWKGLGKGIETGTFGIVDFNTDERALLSKGKKLVDQGVITQQELDSMKIWLEYTAALKKRRSNQNNLFSAAQDLKETEEQSGRKNILEGEVAGWDTLKAGVPDLEADVKKGIENVDKSTEELDQIIDTYNSTAASDTMGYDTMSKVMDHLVGEEWSKTAGTIIDRGKRRNQGEGVPWGVVGGVASDVLDLGLTPWRDEPFESKTLEQAKMNFQKTKAQERIMEHPVYGFEEAKLKHPEAWEDIYADMDYAINPTEQLYSGGGITSLKKKW